MNRPLHLGIRNVGPVPPAGVDQAADLQFPVGASHRSGGDSQLSSKIAHWWKPGSDLQVPGPDGCGDLGDHLGERRPGGTAVNDNLHTRNVRHRFEKRETRNEKLLSR